MSVKIITLKSDKGKQKRKGKWAVIKKPNITADFGKGVKARE